MHRGEVVVTVHPEISTIRAEGRYLEQLFWFQVLSVGSYCKEQESYLTSSVAPYANLELEHWERVAAVNTEHLLQ